jgi:hypothetical protein
LVHTSEVTVVLYRWRTALIIRELEEEIVALEKGVPFRKKLKALLKKKEIIGVLCKDCAV